MSTATKLDLAERRRQKERQRQAKRLEDTIKGIDYVSFLRKIARDLKDTEERLKIAVAHMNIVDDRGRKVIEDKIVPSARLFKTLVERARATHDEPLDVH